MERSQNLLLLSQTSFCAIYWCFFLPADLLVLFSVNFLVLYSAYFLGFFLSTFWCFFCLLCGIFLSCFFGFVLPTFWGSPNWWPAQNSSPRFPPKHFASVTQIPSPNKHTTIQKNKITGNEPEFGAIAKDVCLLSEQYSPEWDKCKLGISVKSLFCQITIGNPSPIVWRWISESANAWEFKAARSRLTNFFSIALKRVQNQRWL